jgi:hypothetical protein
MSDTLIYDFLGAKLKPKNAVTLTLRNRTMFEEVNYGLLEGLPDRLRRAGPIITTIVDGGLDRPLPWRQRFAIAEADKKHDTGRKFAGIRRMPAKAPSQEAGVIVQSCIQACPFPLDH